MLTEKKIDKNKIFRKFDSVKNPPKSIIILLLNRLLIKIFFNITFLTPVKWHALNHSTVIEFEFLVSLISSLTLKLPIDHNIGIRNMPKIVIILSRLL